MKIKYLEKSYSTLTVNWKEESLLKKKLSLLENLKKHEARTWLMEQKAVYRQYCKKLWRSELAHARLLGNQDLVRRLTKDKFFSSYSSVMAGGEPVQSRRDKRKTPIPGYDGSNRDDFSPATNGSLLVEKGSKKHQNRSLEASKRKLNLDAKQSSLERNMERRKLSARQEWGSLDKQLQFYLLRGKEQEGQEQKSISANYRSHFNQRLPSSSNQQHLATTHVGWDKPVDGQDTASGRPKNKFLGHLCYSGRRESGYLAKSRFSSKKVLLGQEEETYTSLQAEIQSMMNQTPHFKEKVKHYLRKVVIPPWHAPLPEDHYTKGPQGKGGKDSCYVWDSKADIEQEWRKWLLVGPESSSRSITLKKLDWCFAQKAATPEILFLENYNAILTKESLIDNNRYCSTTKLS